MSDCITHVDIDTTTCADNTRHQGNINEFWIQTCTEPTEIDKQNHLWEVRIQTYFFCKIRYCYFFKYYF